MAAKKKPKTKALSLYSKFRKTDEEWRTGRPKIEINQRAFEELCLNQMPLDSICIVLGASDDTINRWCKEVYDKTFAAVWKVFAEYRNNKLKGCLFDTAMGNRTKTISVKGLGLVTIPAEPDPLLLKFLAKNLLDMTENGPKDLSAKTQTTINNNNAPGNSVKADIKVQIEYVEKPVRSDINDEWSKEEYDHLYDDEADFVVDEVDSKDDTDNSDAVDGEVEDVD